MTMKKWLTISMLNILLQGCFPVYKTIRIPVEINVIDEKGKTLKGVKVVRMTEQTPARVLPEFDSSETDSEGFAQLAKEKKWAVESFFIHGVQHYTWTLCISKDGYETIDDIKLDPDDQVKPIFTLKKTKNKTQECIDNNLNF